MTHDGGRRRRRTGDPSEDERALRELAGDSPSYVDVSRALRARDVNRPSEQDLADAERTVRIERRDWRPPS